MKTLLQYLGPEWNTENKQDNLQSAYILQPSQGHTLINITEIFWFSWKKEPRIDSLKSREVIQVLWIRNWTCCIKQS